ncbi:MAG: hypothetical protein ABSB49_02365 [Polyangia bacterium]|jgi:hypothetical protein
MKKATDNIVCAVKDVLADVIDIQDRVDRNPYGVAAAAFGVGFVLGGGLFSQLSARVLGAVLRAGLLAALPRLEQELGCACREAKAADSAVGKGE